MDRSFDYTQKILVAVEIGAEPARLADMPPTYARFQRLSLGEIAQAAGAQQIANPGFQAMVARHMGYWEERIPKGQRLVVHYAIGSEEAIGATFRRLAAEGDRFTHLGVHRVEPQSSCYPASFPARPAPSHWQLGQEHGLTAESIYWFNFFPEQPYLFEKTFASWASFVALKGTPGVECNQLVHLDAEDRLRSRGVDPFVQVNLNRFTSLSGFFGSAHAAGEQSFTGDDEYRWYGMLLRKM